MVPVPRYSTGTGKVPVKYFSQSTTEANTDRRFKMEGEVVNFFVHYEIDDNKSRHVLKLDAYGGEVVDSWVLLEALA